MPLKEFSCKQCGNCCLNLSDAFSTCADEKDIEQWEKSQNSIDISPSSAPPPSKGRSSYNPSSTGGRGTTL
jgi:hypothetical protein